MARTDTRVVLWAAAAVAACAAVAVAVGTSAGARPAALSNDDVANALAGDGPPGPTSSPTTVTLGQAGAIALDSVAGTVIARCDDGVVTLVSWSPHPGYWADNSVRRTGTSAAVTFESDTSNNVTLTVTCVGGRPTLTVTTVADDHGGSTTPGAGPGAGPGTDPAPVATPAGDDHDGGGSGGGGKGGGGAGGGGGGGHGG